MSVRRFDLHRIGLATAVPRGRGIWIPQAGTGGGGEFGADIDDNDRTFAIIREPVAHRVVFTVAHDIFDNWFELKLEGDDTGDESKTFDKGVQAKLTDLDAKQELTLMSVFERTYGYAILVLGYEQNGDFELYEPVKDATGLREIKAYSKPQVKRVDTVKDQKDPRYGLPEYYNIKRPGVAAYLKIHFSRVIHFATRRSYYSTDKDEWQGLSVLDPIWDDLVTLRNIRWGMGQTMYRYGSGFPDITFTGAEKSDIQDFIDSGAFANLSARTYFVHNENQELEFKGLAGRALDPMQYYLPIMENISAGTGVPLAILRGVQAGALTGSEVNQQEYYGLISDEQSGYEPGIRKLIEVIQSFSEKEKANPGSDFKFDWQGGFELDEEKKARIDQIEAQTLQVKGQWHTRNELRKMEDPNAQDLTPEQGGDEILGKSEGAFKQPFEEFKEGDSYLVTEVGKRRPSRKSR